MCIRDSLAADDQIRSATDSYIDDIVVNEDKVAADQVVVHLHCHGLEAKPPKNVNGSRVLGLRVITENSTLIWKRDSAIPIMADRVTKRDLFSWCGKMVKHNPLAGCACVLHVVSLNGTVIQIVGTSQFTNSVNT